MKPPGLAHRGTAGVPGAAVPRARRRLRARYRHARMALRRFARRPADRRAPLHAAASAPNLRELTSEARFRVRVLFIDAYRYEHRARESWRGDCLERLDARTDDERQTDRRRRRASERRFRVTPAAPPRARRMRADLRLLEPEHPRCDAAC